MNILLSIENVSKTYDKVKAVDNITLQLPAQTIFGLLGPNGAGKTTLIRMITGILIQDEGRIALIGTQNTLERSHKIGYMPEERGLYKKMKVGEQLLYLAQLKNLSYRQAHQNARQWLERLQMADWWNKPVGELSKGMQQKVQFVATVIHNPDLIILDEPFSGLDPINANLIKDEIYRLRTEGATILFSTHRMEQVEEICEQIALINKGRIVLQGTVKGIKQQFKANRYKIELATDNLATHLQLSQNDAQFDLIEQQDQQLIIELHPNVSPNQVLQSLIAQNLPINGFQEILPSLNEIFITQVQNNFIEN